MSIYYEVRTRENNQIQSHLAETARDLSDLVEDLTERGVKMIGCYKIMEDENGSLTSVKVKIKKAGKVTVVTILPPAPVIKPEGESTTPPLQPISSEEEDDAVAEEGVAARAEASTRTESPARQSSAPPTEGPARAPSGPATNRPART